jgi:hypothetical protein
MLRPSTWQSGGSSDRGVALLVVVAAMVLVLAIGSALILTSVVETRIASASRHDALVLSAADAAAARVLVDLRAADWNAVLAGAVSALSDGPPAGERTLTDGAQLDLDADTSELQCGQRSACSDLDIATVGEGRPWGARNPRWRLFAYGPMALWFPDDPEPPGLYLAVWVADDPADADDDPWRDGETLDNPGRGVILVTGRAYGRSGTRRTVQLAVERTGTSLRILARHERPR